MDQIQHLLFDQAPKPVAPFSHAVKVNNWLFLTGQMPTDPQNSDLLLPEGIIAQTDRVMANLTVVLKHCGASFADIVQLRGYLTQFERDYADFNKAYKSWFKTGKLPARTTVGVTALAVGALVEVDCIAFLNNG